MLPQCMLPPSLLSPHCPTCQPDCIASHTFSAHLAILFPPRCACSSPQLPRGATGPGRRHGPIKPTLSQRKQLKTSITTHQKRGEAMPKPLKTTPQPLKTKTPLRAEMNSLLPQVLSMANTIVQMDPNQTAAMTSAMIVFITGSGGTGRAK